MSPTQFDPAAHPPLTGLGTRLRELAGDAAYKAGREYLRKGRVQDGAVALRFKYVAASVADPSVPASVSGDYVLNEVFGGPYDPANPDPYGCS